MAVHVHPLGSRFYVYSGSPIDPANRLAGSGDILVVMCHGYYKSKKTTRVRGVDHCAFFAEANETADPDQVVKGLKELHDGGGAGNGGFYEDRTKAGGDVTDYTLTKELAKDSKKKHKGKAVSYEFVNKDYLKHVLAGYEASFDIVGLHNTWSSSRVVQFSDLFSTLDDKCAGVYKRLYCGFCREFAGR